MAKFYLLLFFTVILLSQSFAQATADSAGQKKSDTVIRTATPDAISPVLARKQDSIMRADSTAKKRDSLLRLPQFQYRPSLAGDYTALFRQNRYFNFGGEPILPLMRIHQRNSYDGLFYLLFVIFLYFGLLKVIFPKYFANIFALFFRLSMRQQQIREQLMQSPLPSLLFNLLFFISGGLYASFLIEYYHIADKIDFWLLFAYCAALLMVLYLGKLCLLKATGWIFNISQAADTYIFIVFLANKILGIVLLPFLVLLSFGGPLGRDIGITISISVVLILFGYRFIVSFSPVRKEIKVSGFHFFLYLCAFEVAPLLLIYKVLLAYLEKAY